MPTALKRPRGCIPTPEADGDDPALQAAKVEGAVAPLTPADHRLRMSDADVALLEAALAVRLLAKLPEDGMWLGRDDADHIAGEVRVYERLRRARLTGDVGRAIAAPVGPGLVTDLLASKALLGMP